MNPTVDSIVLPHGVVSFLTSFKPEDLVAASYNPAERTEAKEVERLRCSIIKLGNHILNPLHVYGGPIEGISDARTNEVLDGHRRRYCALDLGIPTVKAFVYYGPYEVVKQLFVELNSSAKKLTKRQMMEVMSKGGPEFDEVAKDFHQLQALLSDLEFEMFIERGISPFCLGLAKSAVKYLNVKPEAAKYNDWLRKTVVWLAFSNQQQQCKAFLRHFSAIRDKKTTFTVSKLRKAVEDDIVLAW